MGGSRAETDALERRGVLWGLVGVAIVVAITFIGSDGAVVRVVTVDGDGQVHFAILPGSVAKNRHLLDRAVARPRAARRQESALPAPVEGEGRRPWPTTPVGTT